MSADPNCYACGGYGCDGDGRMACKVCGDKSRTGYKNQQQESPCESSAELRAINRARIRQLEEALKDMIMLASVGWSSVNSLAIAHNYPASEKAASDATVDILKAQKTLDHND